VTAWLGPCVHPGRYEFGAIESYGLNAGGQMVVNLKATPAIAFRRPGTACGVEGLGVGMQAIQPWGQPGTQYTQYTAAQAQSAFAQADLAGADYFELYTPSWLSANGGQVWRAPMAEWLEGTPEAASMSVERRRLRSIIAALGELLGYPDERDPYLM